MEQAVESMRAKNEDAWKKLKPGFQRIFLSKSTIDALQELYARGKLTVLFSPQQHMAAYLHCVVTRREVETRRTGSEINAVATTQEAAA